ncbi:hypothetical protein [Methylocapsa acidiphila]|uniref:hypothetical protein n=1 Tax=Methylocapsa acidiphila TaxID=133552 RepID=UPI0003FE8211|nr:hypothetical protein [Methylocapsa acidiphila]
MDVSSFLKFVPGALGVAGLLTYIWPGKAQFTGQVFTTVVNKLRASSSVRIENYDRLTPEQIVRLIDSDSRVKGALTEREIGVIRLLATTQFARRSLVLLVCSALIALSAWLVLHRRAPLAEREASRIFNEQRSLTLSLASSPAISPAG